MEADCISVLFPEYMHEDSFFCSSNLLFSFFNSAIMPILDKPGTFFKLYPLHLPQTHCNTHCSEKLGESEVRAKDCLSAEEERYCKETSAEPYAIGFFGAPW